MLFTLEVLKAFEGDCLLLHWGDPGAPRLAVIDGGPGRTYDEHLRPRLLEIADNRGADPLAIEFAMVTHVDNDHVVGIDKLFRDLQREIERNDPRPLKVKRLWHNTFDDIVGNRLDAHYATFTAAFTASAGPDPSLPPDSVKPIADRLRQELGDEDEAEHLAYDISKILAGHGEGRKLRDKHAFLHRENAIAALNAPFAAGGAGTLITAARTPEPLDLAGIKIHVVGPREEEIDALQAAFDAYLVERGLNTAEATLAAYADKSVPNLSSIVCMVSAQVNGVERRMLLTGDARGDTTIEVLERAGYLENGTVHVDVLKVPHHGSDRNATQGFFDTIKADTYVLSASGKHGNPDRPTLEWIFNSRAPGDRFTIVMTYTVEETDRKREEESHRWNRETDSLQLLFEAKRNEGYDFELREGGPIKIELGDEAVGW